MSNKKSFLANNTFFSDPEPETTEEKALSIPKGYKLVPEDARILPTETKKARLQLLITPTLKDAIKRIADAENVSVNEICNQALTQYTEAYNAAGEEYNG